MRTMKVLAVAAALGVAACGGQTTGPDTPGTQHSVQLGDEVRLRVNDSAVVSGTDMRVTFVGVPGDSRCPIDAVCVWQGDAEVRLDLTENRAVVHQTTLHTGVEPKVVEFNSYRIELLEVAPARRSNDEIRQRDYSVRLRISGR